MLQRSTGLQPNSIELIQNPKKRQAGIFFTVFFFFRIKMQRHPEDRCHTWCISMTSRMLFKDKSMEIFYALFVVVVFLVVIATICILPAHLRSSPLNSTTSPSIFGWLHEYIFI